MVPKLADFGSSKLFGKGLTMVISKNLSATIGYVPPEYYSHQVVSEKFDIFSLGVVMTKIIAGPRGNSLSAEMDYQDFLDQVHENWRKRFQEKWHNSELLQAYCQQVNICITIALSCMDCDRFKRPSILDIINELNESETVIEELNPDHRWTRISDANRTPAIDSQKQSLALEEVRFLVNNLTLENNRLCEPSVSPRKEFHPNILDLPSDQRTSYRGQKSTEILVPTRLPNSPPSSRGKHCPRSHVHSIALGRPGYPTAWQDDARSISPPHPLPLPLPLPPGVPCTSSCFLHSQWKKGKLLGSGTFGQVYLGVNSESGQLCAIKEIKVIAGDSKSKECLRQLNQEIMLLNHLSHPNIVRYYGSELVNTKEMGYYGSELSSETLSLYLEFVSGGSIRKLLREYGPFEEAVLRNYTAQILSGLAYLHRRNIVHRDIKGANVFVNCNGDIKLADFSMTNHISAATSMRSFKGNPYWMAPEVIMNTNAYSLSVDIWSLGCTILEMASARPPWSQYEGVAAIFKIANSKDIPGIPDHLSSEAKSFLKLCLQRDPAARPTADQLIVHPWVKDQASVTKAPVK
ncbi:mitogen-activated protein kinase kinase kinase 3 isoform X1 [Triticum aestivum]|uniref:mitogen-activated protein kinase kinase kinase 3 isoform X1 n=1 Tax=Triticum aestivum TaxID=4565 RepID=UPI001D00B3B7|nr:mitogen-activated protein kinase kinase kinase 3-like isoform X1 [Triticum aestivum]